MRLRSRRRPLVAISVAVGLAVAVTGCEKEGPTGPTQTSSPAPTPPTPPPTGGAAMDQDRADRSGTTQDDGGETPAELGAGAVLTNGDSGAVVLLSPGEEAVLRLTPPLQDSTPAVADPGVVELVPVQHFADPGYAEYALVALSRGETRVAAQAAGGSGLHVLVVVQGR